MSEALGVERGAMLDLWAPPLGTPESKRATGCVAASGGLYLLLHRSADGGT